MTDETYDGSTAIIQEINQFLQTGRITDTANRVVIQAMMKHIEALTTVISDLQFDMFENANDIQCLRADLTELQNDTKVWPGDQ